ncbi:MAG: acyl-CoA thioesterase [Acidimicrobiia bacterium]
MKPDAVRLDPASYPFYVDVQTRESDLDGNRHVNSLSQGLLFREAWGQLQMTVFGPNPPEGGRRFLVANITMDYLGEVQYPGTVRIGAAVLRVGATSLTIGCALFQGGAVCAVCEYTVVHANGEGSVAIPDDVRERAAAYVLTAR